MKKMSCNKPCNKEFGLVECGYPCESNRVQNNYLRGLDSAMVNVCPKFGYRVTMGN